MAHKKRKGPPASGPLLKNVELGGCDTPKDNPQAGKKQEHPHRAGFARGIVFAEFGYRHGRAIDYDGFIDRLPSQSSATTWWRAPT